MIDSNQSMYLIEIWQLPRLKLECDHGTWMTPLMQNSHILTKPKMIYFDEQRAINVVGMVRYKSLLKLKKTL